MAEEVSISWQGMRQLVDAARDQATAMGTASGFVCSAGLNNTGAFRGFLGVFKGTYENAMEAVNDGLADATTGTQDLASLLVSIRDELKAVDQAVGQRHVKISQSVASQGHAQSSDWSLGGVPQPLLDASNLAPGSPVEAAGGMTAGAGAPIGVVDETIKLVNHAQDTGSALDHGEEMEAFIDEHGGDDR